MHYEQQPPQRNFNFRRAAAIGMSVLAAVTFGKAESLQDGRSAQAAPVEMQLPVMPESKPVKAQGHNHDMSEEAKTQPTAEYSVEFPESSTQKPNNNLKVQSRGTRESNDIGEPDKSDEEQTAGDAADGFSQPESTEYDGEPSLLEIPTEELPQTQELINLHPENLSIPEEARLIMRENTLFVSSTGCSGFMVRDQYRAPAGLITSQHCGLLSQHNNIVTDENGKSLANFHAPVTAYLGNSFSDLTPAGNVEKFAISGQSEMTKDVAIGSFEGSDIQEVIEAASFSRETALGLEKGDVVYNSGWPVHQPGNTTNSRRQEFAMHVLGHATWQVTNGQELNLVVAAVPKNEDGAICSFGDSGSVGFTVSNSGEALPIGVLGAFNDFGAVYNTDPQKAAAQKAYIEQTFGVNMDGYDAVCGFAYDSLSADDTRILEIKPPVNESSPVLTPLEQRIFDYHSEFYKDDSKRQIIDGLVRFQIGAGSYVIERPAVTGYDTETDTVLFAWHQNQGKDALMIHPVKLNDLGNLRVYNNSSQSIDGKVTPMLLEANGKLAPSEDGVHLFKTVEGLEFGKSREELQLPSDGAYKLEVKDDGSLSLTIAEQPKPTS